MKTVLTDLGHRDVDAAIAPVQLVHRGKSRTLSNRQRHWLKHQQAIDPVSFRRTASHATINAAS
jgi:IS5 family transposase